ncbi:putative F-box/LRR-repeat protein At5g02930 [Silene latifolia]|uniref:putative F-box/LRR-repeat protein At5g02930 n=1 Tax=Silene latifolia TaxID=37657 RepID=UPI003D7748F9
MANTKTPKLCDLCEENRGRDEHDRISFIPDELLVQIFSFMSLRQAVKTSVLSKRWMNLWTKIPCLTFDGPNIFDQELSSANQRLKSRQFDSRVSKVVSQLMQHSPGILSLSVYYEIAGKDVSFIDQWVSFAVEHDVQRLIMFFRRYDTISWSFPPRLGSNEKVYSINELLLGGVNIVPCFAAFKNLKLVSLSSVSVTDKAFEDLLSNCLLLQDLFLCSAEKLKIVKIPEFLIRLRSLYVYLCPSLLEIEVKAANLIVLSYVGETAKFSFSNISKLRLLRLGGLDEVFLRLMNENLLLQNLALDLHIFLQDFDLGAKVFPPLTNLKVLTLSIAYLSNGYAGIVNLLRATPCLIKFELHMKDPDFVTQESEVAFIEKFRHNCIREIELSGFTGGEGQIKLVHFLIKVAVGLRKFTIYPYHIRFYLNQRLRIGLVEVDMEQLAEIRKCVDQISCELPSTAKLEFIDC